MGLIPVASGAGGIGLSGRVVSTTCGGADRCGGPTASRPAPCALSGSMLRSVGRQRRVGATAYWAYLVAARLGWWPEARRLRGQLTDLIDAHGFREFYDALTGEPGGAGAGSGFTWPALALDMTVPPDVAPPVQSSGRAGAPRTPAFFSV